MTTTENGASPGAGSTPITTPADAVYEAELAVGGQLRLVPLAPATDLDLVYAWVTEERARFWGMGALTREDVLEIYEYLDSLDTHHAYLIEVAGEPRGIFQSYDPLHDPVGEAYPALPGDIGMHLLLAPTNRPIPNFTPVLLSALIRFLFADPARDRIVVEPDARNNKAVRRLRASCFEMGPRIQLAEKEAQLAFLPRKRFERPARTCP